MRFPMAAYARLAQSSLMLERAGCAWTLPVSEFMSLGEDGV